MAYYSKAYHSFWEGYTEQKNIDPERGRAHIRRIYTGWYYTADVPDSDWKRSKGVYAVNYFGSFILLLLCAACRKTGNTQWYVTLPVALTLFGMIWLLTTLPEFLLAPRKMKVSTYKLRKNLISGCGISAICFAASALATLLNLGLSKEHAGMHFIIIACYLLAGSAMYRIHRKENARIYTREESTEKVSGEAYDIQNPEVLKKKR